ncbi:MAG: phosphate signaling complex protein PhoU [Halieaceae bacterium]|jgi:phosphate transport system protein|nr:phosphate signaling complex protein PhoU [Halieaceae bacterium]
MAEPSGQGAHISGQFNAELDAATSHMLEMGGAVERQVLAALDALVEMDSGSAQAVTESDAAINAMEVAIDDECFRILARRQPAAGDLRLVLAITKVIIDLERIGDESSRVARQVIALSEVSDTDPARPWSGRIANTVINMLRAALDAFARRDAQAALAVARGDETIDQQMEGAMQALTAIMRRDPAMVDACVTAMWALRSLKRVGDHARNIAEYVIYMVEGVDVRHTELETLLDWLPEREQQ